MLENFEADLTNDEWELVRELAETFIVQDKFDKDPIRCVVNAFITTICMRDEKKDQYYLN